VKEKIRQMSSGGREHIPGGRAVTVLVESVFMSVVVGGKS
jgi:hypothetical protein